MNVNREIFLQALESVQPGLSSKRMIEQDDCFILRNGAISTYNDEIYCRIPGPLLKDMEAAVLAKPLLEQLRRWKEEEIGIELNDSELILTGKGRKTGIRTEGEITLPVHLVEKPKSWNELPEHFAEAVAMVGQCALSAGDFETVCIHVHPDWIEASDKVQICRWKMKTGIKESILIRRDSIKHIANLGMTEFAETEAWLHFKSASGLRLSCRRYVSDYPDLTKFLKVDGQPTVLPRGLAEAAEKAEVFTAENADTNQVMIDLRPGKLRIRGQGISGWYSEIKKIKYDGEPLRFLMSPGLLSELVKRTNDCEIAPGVLRVNGAGYVYVTCLGVIEDNTAGEMSEETKSEVSERLEKASKKKRREPIEV